MVIGLKIGTVKKIRFSEDTKIEITMSLEQMAQSHIRKDARVKISTDGFIGNRIEVIYGGNGETGILADGDYLQSEKSLSTDDMIAMLQSNNQNLLAITNDFKPISGRIANGQGTIGRLINDPAIEKNLQATIKNFKTASLKAEESVENVSEFTSRLNQDKGLVNELITDTIIFQHLRQSVTQLREVVDTASAIMHNLQTASNQLNQTNNSVGVMLHDEQAAKDLKEAINHSKVRSQKLEEDLEAMQHNFLLRGYFKIKDKTKKTGD